MSTLSSLLSAYMARAQIGSRRLSQKTGIPRTSIDNWRAGTARHPHQWQLLLTIGRVLELSRAEVDALLAAADYPSLDTLAHDLSVDHSDWQYVEHWLATRDPEPGVPPTLLLHQLRAPVTDFVGRDDTIAKLVTTLKAGGNGAIAAITGVRGMGGIGKTELAYVLASRLADAFPDAQIVLPLRGTTTTPLSPEQALQQVIHTFTPDAQLPEDIPALQQHYCAALYGRRVLILADDARDAAQVQPLMPPAGSTLLVTSRQRFSLPGIVTVDVEPLADTEAVAFLCRSCQRLALDEARTIAQLCGSLPLALRVSGSILHNDTALPVAEFIQRLRDETQRLAQLRDPEDEQLNVEASLTLSYALLDVESQRVFRQLGALEADFATDLALALVEVDVNVDTKAILHHLLRRNLVMYDTEHGRWRLHDLVRDMARQRLSAAGEADSTKWRYAEAAIRIAEAIHNQYLADGTRIVEHLARFDAERPHFDAARVWGAAHRGTPAGDRLILAMALATLRLDELRSDAERERIPQQEAALAAAQRLGERSAEGQLLVSLGRATFDLGTPGRAIPYWEQAFEIFRALDDTHNQALTLGNLGTGYARLGDPRRAISAYEQALPLFRGLGDRRHEAHALGNLGAAYAQLSEPHTAIDYLEQALAFAREIGDRLFEAMLLQALGNVTRGLGDGQRTLSVCMTALAIAREIGDRQQEGYTLTSLGRAHSMLGEHARAIAAFEKALRILQEIGDRWGVATCRWHYGLAIMSQGEHHAALPMLRASAAYMAEIGHPESETHLALLARLEAGE